MTAIFRIPKYREVEINGPRNVRELIQELKVNPELVIVIRGDEVLAPYASLNPTDVLEVRPAIAGG